MDFLRCQNKLRAQMQTQGNMTAIRNLARAFRSMDESQKGVLTKEQFERALGYCHMFLNNQEVETIMSHYDLKHDGTMVYEDFIQGMRGSPNARRKLLVQSLFNKLSGGRGTIALKDLQDAFNPDAHPPLGAYINGLFMAGARWDDETMHVEDSFPKVLWDDMSPIWIKPCDIENDATDPDKVYQCPIYKTSDRKGVLSTSGHSSNFIMWLAIDHSCNGLHSEYFWTKRGVALISQTDD